MHSADEVAIARRRTLLRAASSAPLVLGFAPNAALAKTSATLAEKDAELIPLGIPDPSETWIRENVSLLVGEIWYKFNANENGGKTLRAAKAYRREPLAGQYVYYTLDPSDLSRKGVLYNGTGALGDKESFQNATLETISALVLFNTDTYCKQGTWPDYDAWAPELQGLHQSAMGSLVGMGRVPTNCSGA